MFLRSYSVASYGDLLIVTNLIERQSLEFATLHAFFDSMLSTGRAMTDAAEVP